MPNDSNRPDVAVFIDFENVYVSVRDKLDANPNFESIMDRCEDFGRVVIARAYADWYRYPRVTSALYANGIEPMYVPTYYYDREMGRTGRAIKNSVDMNLCIDAMKTLFTNTNIAKFVLATGDRDFIPLVNSIRQQGKEVIIIGIGGAASAHLAQSADEFIFYESLVGKKPAELHRDQPRGRSLDREPAEAEEETSRTREAPREREAPRASEPQPQPQREAAPTTDIYDVLVNAINLARERGYVCSFGSLKLLMKELMDGDFKESRYKDAGGKPFAKFKDFVLEAERRGKVQVFTNGTVNEVFLPGEDPYKLSQFAQELKEEPEVSPLETPSIDVRHDARGLGATNGRRRRRRTRGQRPGSPQDEAVTLPEEADDEEEAAEIEYTAPDDLSLPDLLDDAQADAVFDELLERVEDADAESRALSALDPLELLEPPDSTSELSLATPELVAPAEPAEESPATAEGEGAPGAVSQPFTDEEWRLLVAVVERFDRPVSFVQIHDALRDARKISGIARTNEELRTLIKQAINTGMLERSGKGNRVSYRLAAPAETAEGAPDQTEAITMPIGAATDQAGASEASEFYTPEAAAQAEQAAPPEVAPVEVITAAEPALAEPETTPRRTRARRKPAAEAAPAEAAPAEPETTPKRTRARRKPAAEAAPAEAAPAEPKPARRRQPRKKPTEA